MEVLLYMVLAVVAVADNMETQARQTTLLEELVVQMLEMVEQVVLIQVIFKQVTEILQMQTLEAVAEERVWVLVAKVEAQAVQV